MLILHSNHHKPHKLTVSEASSVSLACAPARAVAAVASSLPVPRAQSPPRSPPLARSRRLAPRPARAVIASLLARSRRLAPRPAPRAGSNSRRTRVDSRRTRRRGCTGFQRLLPLAAGQRASGCLLSLRAVAAPRPAAAPSSCWPAAAPLAAALRAGGCPL
jgi:hypothetical protein